MIKTKKGKDSDLRPDDKKPTDRFGGEDGTFAQAEMERRNEGIEAEEKTGKERKFLDTAMERLKRATDHDSHNRREFLADLRFSNGQDQWEESVKNERKKEGRPALQFDLITENINQVVGDERHNRVRAKVRPVDSKADPQIAKIRQGIIHNIEYLSSAERIYDYAMEMLCRGGYAAWEILTRYTDENPFLQEIYMQRIPNPLAVYMDPDATDEIYSDARWGFKISKMPLKEFEVTYPDADPVPPGETLKTGIGFGYENWFDKETITVADYYIVSSKKTTMALLSDGRVMEKKEAEEEVETWKSLSKASSIINQSSLLKQPPTPSPQPPGGGGMGMSPGGPTLPPAGGPPSPPPSAMPGQIVPPKPTLPPMGGGEGGMGMGPPAQGPIAPPGASPPGSPPPFPPSEAQTPVTPASPFGAEKDMEELRIVKERETNEPRVLHYTITANEILSKNGMDGERFPGKFVPLIVVKGPEINIEGKPYWRSFIRPAKDPQKNYNYWVSAAAEAVALAPKAEWIGTPKQFQGFEKDYALSNRKNFPMLKYNVDDDYLPFVPPPPQRVSVKEPPVAMFTEMANAKQAVKDGLGLHQRDVGEAGNERSGAAINAVQKPGDIGSYQFFDNLKRSIVHGCRVINEMIPEVYDSERDVRIRNQDESDSFMPINTTLTEALRRMRDDPDRYKGMDVKAIKAAIRKGGPHGKYNDVTIGKYDIEGDAGPSYATQRAESAEQLLRLANVDKRIMQIGGDLIVRSMDFALSDELADRLKKSLPPGLVELKEGEKPAKPMPPQPQALIMMQKMKTEELKQQKETIKTKVELVKLYKETKESDKEVRKTILEILQQLHAPNAGEEGGMPGGMGGGPPPPPGGNGGMRGVTPAPARGGEDFG